jgi:amino acid permease
MLAWPSHRSHLLSCSLEKLKKRKTLLVGVLSLPAGIATFGNAPSAAIPAILLIAALGSLSGYGFGLIGRVCALTGTTSYRGAWEASVSRQSSWIPAVSVTLKTICATLAYSMILGDTFHALALAAGLTAVSKTAVLCTVTTGVLLPLCLLKNLSSLAPFSLLGSLGMVYTAVAMAIRYFGGAYAVGGVFAKDLPATLRPAFGSAGAASALSPVTTILLGMLSTAYMAHFNAPKFYTELKNNTVPRYLTVVSTSFGISIVLFSLIAALGFLTFGGNCAGLILNNYSTRDTLMSISRIAVAVSLVFSYPLAFVGARDGVIDLFSVKNKSASVLNAITVGLLASITGAALIIPDVSFVLAFAGYVVVVLILIVDDWLRRRYAVLPMCLPRRSHVCVRENVLTSPTTPLLVPFLIDLHVQGDTRKLFDLHLPRPHVSGCHQKVGQSDATAKERSRRCYCFGHPGNHFGFPGRLQGCPKHLVTERIR